MSQVEELYTLFLETYLLLDDNERHFFDQYDLSSARYHALWHIQKSPGLSLRELSSLLLCTKGNTTRIVKSLEAEGYLTRQVDQDDNRVLCLNLTAKGQTLLGEVAQAYQEFRQACFGKLSFDEQGSFRFNLLRLNEYLRARLQSL